MKIKTITCHDVYNVGASLQSYALMKYLQKQGHDVEIIDYKPEYLSRHYRLNVINNPKYDYFFVKQAYILAKLPQRLIARCGKRKRNFDRFRENYLKLTDKHYCSYQALLEDCPEAELYIAGSDQIWNPLFPNGKDAAFFLQFVPDCKKRISYAASFATDEISDEDKKRMTIWLEKFDAVSVREESALSILETMGIQGKQVCDPVFLLNALDWGKIAVDANEKNYLFVYDFDNNSDIDQIADWISKKQGLNVCSVFPMNGNVKVLKNMGPLEFLGSVKTAKVVLSNSFHATAFSLLFHKEFYVVNRQDSINTRMRDLLKLVGLEDRLLHSLEEIEHVKPIEWDEVDKRLKKNVDFSQNYLKMQTTKEI